MIITNIIALIVGAVLGFTGQHFNPEPILGSQPTITAFAGGTGTTSPSGILYGDETIRLKTVGIGSGLLFSGGTLSATGGTGASTTLLADHNTFSGNNTFSNTITGAITGNAGSATVLQTSRNINGVAFNGSANITINAASSTLLSDNNTFTNTITGSITGNAGTASALAANGANCSAGNYPLGVNASGAVEDCTAVSGGSTFPFTATANYNSTSTPIGFLAGLFSNSSTTLNGTVQIGENIDINSNYLSIAYPTTLNLISDTAQDGIIENRNTSSHTWSLPNIDGWFIVGPETPTVSSLYYAGSNGSAKQIATSSASCAGGTSCSAFTVVGSVAPVIRSFGYPFPSNATTTELAFNGGFLSTASTTINARFELPSLSAGGLGVDGLGKVFSTPTTTFSGGLTYLNGNVTADLGTSVDISSETNLAGDTEIVLTGDALSIASTIARDTELHNAVTLAGEDYLSLSTQQITANAIDPDNLSASDFGAFTCNGTNCSLDTSYENPLTFTWPLIRSTNTITFGGLSTSSPIAAASGLLYATGVNTLASISTSSAINLSITGTAGQALSLAENGDNCAAGSYPLGVDPAGVAEDCTPVSTFSYPFPSNATTTLLSFNGGASTTLLSANYASSTLYYGAGLANCNTGNMLTWTSGRFGCEDDTSGGGGGTSDFTFADNFGDVAAATSSAIWAQGGIYASSSVIIDSGYGLQVNGIADLTGASSIAIEQNAITLGANNITLSGAGGYESSVTASGYSFNNPTTGIGILNFDSLTDTRTFTFPDTTGTVCIVGVECDGSGSSFSYPFPSNATTTQIAFNGGLTAVGATTTALAVTGSSTISSVLNVGGVLNANAGVVGNLTGTASLATALAANGANCSSGSAPLGVDASGAVETCFDVWTEAENTSAAYAAQATTLTVAGTANQVSSSAGAQSLASNRTWTLSLPSHVIFPGNFQATNATTTNATTTSLNVLGEVDIDGLTSALIVTGAGGILAEYGGAAACTNQFVTTISAVGGTTCASINNAQWSGTDLSVANGGTGLSTFGGTNTLLYTTAADTLSSEAALTYAPTTDLLTVVNASTTNLTAGSFLQVPFATSFTNFVRGFIGLDTSPGGNYVGATTTVTGSEHFVIASATTTLYSFVVASTSPDFASGGVIELPAHFLAQRATAIICQVDGGTSQQIVLSNEAGSSDSNTITCTTTSTQFPLTTNNSFAAYAAPRLEFVTKSGVPDYISIRIVGYRVTD